MKKVFLVAMGIVLAIVVTAIGYGTYLNQAGESNIKGRLADRRLDLRGAKVTERDIHAHLSVDTVNIYSNDMTDAIALVDGRIDQVKVKKNDHVSQGTVLCSLTNEQLPVKLRQAEIDILKAEQTIVKAEGDIAKAEAGLAKAENDYGRYSRLRERDAVTPQKYEEALAFYKEARVNLRGAHVAREQAESQRDYLVAQKDQLLIDSSHTQVTAPIEGDVLLIYKQQGAYVTAGTALALIGDFRHLYFMLPTKDEDAKGLTVGSVVNLIFHQNDLAKIYDTEYVAGNAGARQKFTARIVSVSPELGESAAMRSILFEVDNGAGLLEPQTYNQVTIESAVSQRVLAIPLTAVGSSRTEVFVLDKEGILQKRTVVTGIDDGMYVEIKSGLAAGDIVVTSDTEGLESGMKAEVTLEGGV